jgi:hypothetical protein
MKISKIKVRDNNKFWNKPRIYFFIKETILENLQERHCRPYKEYRQLIPKIFKKLKIPINTKAKWSQKAGCHCGCSPGFILDLDNYGRDIFVDVK